MNVLKHNNSLSKLKLHELHWLHTFYGYKPTILKQTMIQNLTYVYRKQQILNQIYQKQSTNLPEECPICYSNITTENTIVTHCYHAFCETCIVQHVLFHTESCPICRSKCTYSKIVETMPLQKQDSIREQIRELKISLQNSEYLSTSDFQENYFEINIHYTNSIILYQIILLIIIYYSMYLLYTAIIEYISDNPQ